MLSIQEVGKDVLLGQPKNFYVFVGEEYGIKRRYLSILKDHYGEYSEVDHMQDIIDLMGSNHLIPLQPKLYVVRYDDEFIQHVDDSTYESISSLDIIGTVVCLYELPKHTSRCLKYLGDCTVSFDAVNPQFIHKYLLSDFPSLSTQLIEMATTIRGNYQGAYNICSCMSHINPKSSSHPDTAALTKLFTVFDDVTDNQFKTAIAGRNFDYSLSVLDTYNGDVCGLYYAILSTLIELEKLISNPRAQSELRCYVRSWSISDVYNLFMHTYAELENSRHISGYDTYNSIVYLLGLMCFSPIPSEGVWV